MKTYLIVALELKGVKVGVESFVGKSLVIKLVKRMDAHYLRVRIPNEFRSNSTKCFCKIETFDEVESSNSLFCLSK